MQHGKDELVKRLKMTLNVRYAQKKKVPSDLQDAARSPADMLSRNLVI
jgi:hypothetical protein